MTTRVLVWWTAALVLAGCPGSARPVGPVYPGPGQGQGVDPERPPPPPPPGGGGGGGGGAGPGGDEPPVAIDVRRVESAADVPATPPAAGTFRLHLIDVGTGLAVLVQGHDFALLYDAGTGDPVERPLRILAYLARVLGPSGDDLCVGKGEPTPGQRQRLHHVVLSHPHLDHASALDEVLHCFAVDHLWDSGAINDTAFLRETYEVIARSPALALHTAAAPPPDRTVAFKKGAIVVPAAVAWDSFSEGDVVELGVDASFQILHADGKKRSDPNQNSVVIALRLGRARVLLVGDAESGPRADPSAPVGDIEEHLLDHHLPALAADVLQVGHHGSKTSSRMAFLRAVAPRYALVSAGPKAYKTVVLPDAEVLAALRAVGATVLRTDERDAACPLTGRLGGDRGPGGCDSYVLTLDPTAP